MPRLIVEQFMELMLFDAGRDTMEELPSSPEIAARVESCQRMMYQYARKVHARCPRVDYDEIVSHLERCLWRAAVKFDPARGFKFSTFAGNSLKRGTWNIATRFRDRRRLPTQALDTKFDFRRTPNVLQRLVDAEEKADRAATLAHAMDGLTERERHIVDGRFVRGLTLREIGIELGLTRERVRQLEAVILERMRRMMLLRDRVAPTRDGITVPT